MKYASKLKLLPTLFALLLSILIIAGLAFWATGRGFFHNDNEGNKQPSAVSSPVASAAPEASPSGAPSPGPSASPSVAPSSQPSAGPSVAAQASPQAPLANGKVDLTVDSNGLSRTTVVINSTQGVIKFKFYPQDAPNTVNRFIELIKKGFYNGLTFHRVVPGFVVQGGDPLGNGTGGSGQKLKAEFNDRRHIEGAVAMARAQDPNSADSQFYIALGTLPALDHNYTVFGQVIEGMDVVRKLKVGDKMTSVTLE
jgi:cyclophilin family peptidyl-prolyl cis-trans isomerase